MAARILQILTILYLAITTTNASIEPGNGGGAGADPSTSATSTAASADPSDSQNPLDFWKQQFGDMTKIPKAIQDAMNNAGGQSSSSSSSSSSIQSTDSSGKPTHVTVGPDTGVGVHTSKAGKGHADVDVNPFNGIGVNAAGKKGATDLKLNPWDGLNINAGTPDKPVYVGVKPGLNPFQYNYDKNSQGLGDPTSRSLFFLQKDMKPGNCMKLHLPRKTNIATFLPKNKAESLPFSSHNLSAILREFSMEPGSAEAKAVEETIKGCEHKGIRGEEKYCATSLESLVDYAKKTFGKNVRAMSTEIEEIVDKIENYTISAIRKLTKDNKEPAVCHKQNYAYAVFYCHKTKGTSAYMISLMSQHGSKAKSMAVCHKDTSAWNPEHLAFDALKVKPGSAPICHFLPEDHIVWVPY